MGVRGGEGEREGLVEKARGGEAADKKVEKKDGDDWDKW